MFRRRQTKLTVVALVLLLLFSGLAQAKTTLNVWVRGALEKDFSKVVEQFEAANPDIQVNLAFTGRNVADMNQKALTAMAAGSPPDLIGLSQDFVMQSKVNGFFIDLTPYLRRQNYGYTFFPSLLDQGRTDDGRLILAPFWVSLPLIFWNGDMFEAAGIPADKGPVTWTDLRQFARKLTKRDGDKVTQYGIAGLWASGLTWFPAYWSAGSDVFDANGDLLLKPGNKAAEWALQLWQDFHVTDQTAHTSWETIFDGLSAIAMTGMTLVPTYQRLNPVWPLHGAMIPRHESGEHKPYLGMDGWCIPKGSTNPDAAWRFIDFVSRPDIQREYMKTHGGSWVNGASGVRESYTSELFATMPIWSKIAQSLQTARSPQIAFVETNLGTPLNNMLVNMRKGVPVTQELENFAAIAQARLQEWRAKQ